MEKACNASDHGGSAKHNRLRRKRERRWLSPSSHLRPMHKEACEFYHFAAVERRSRVFAVAEWLRVQFPDALTRDVADYNARKETRLHIRICYRDKRSDRIQVWYIWYTYLMIEGIHGADIS